MGMTLTLFGSQARSDSELGLDVDGLVLLTPSVNPSEEIKWTGKAVSMLPLH